MSVDRLIIGVPVILILLYGTIGWLLVVRDMDGLVDDLYKRGAFEITSKPRFMMATLRTLLRRIATWPGWRF